MSESSYDVGFNHEWVTLQRGCETCIGYLCLPAELKSLRPAILIIPGHLISEDYICNTATILSHRGYVSLTLSFTSLSNVFGDAKSIREALNSQSSLDRLHTIIRSGTEFLRSLPSVAPNAVRLSGFGAGADLAYSYANKYRDVSVSFKFTEE